MFKKQTLLLILILFLASFLRLYKLSSVPPSLYWDEASLGYNAYSILKTAHDEHQKFLPLTNFAAFGDYKPPLYIYATVPSIAVFGLTEFAIRFPSALSGILTILVCYFLAKRLFKNESIAQVSALFLAISPWHIQLSRAAFEANLGLLFSSLGILFFLKFTQKPIYIVASALAFLAAIYTFTGQRLFVPFILIVLSLNFYKDILKNIKMVAVTALVAFIIFYPLFKFATGTIEGRLRFNEVTIFNDLAPINESIHYRATDKFAWWSDILHNRRIYITNYYLIHYFDAFNPTFLFTKGDANPRFSNQEVGELYYLDLALIIAGIYFLFSKKHHSRFLIIGWLLVSPLGAATARETPHALRMIHILPTFQMIAAWGLYNLYQLIKFKKILIIAVTTIFTLNLLYFLEIYFYHYPLDYSDQWQYGYKQMVTEVSTLYPSADHIVVTKNLGRPYIYFLLYLKYDPKQFWASADVQRDQFYFLDVKSFDKFVFTDSLDGLSFSGKTVYVMPKNQTPPYAKMIKSITKLNGDVVFEISQNDTGK